MVRASSRNAGKFTHCQKLKQHKRTCHRTRPTTSVTRRECHISGDIFHQLPTEVFDMILDKLSVLDLSVLSMVSKQINGHVMKYISTLAWKNKRITENFHCPTFQEQTTMVGHYNHLSLLFKRCTLLLPTKDRLKFIFSKISQIPCFAVDQCLLPDCTGFSIFGVFLQTVIAGWDELECHRVFNFLCGMTHLLQKVETVLTGTPGTKWYQELQVRLFCRQVLLDQWSYQPDCQFWLRLLLKPFPLVSQARLLFILYGPLLPDGTLNWQSLVERELPRGTLWDMAKAIHLLFGDLDVKDQTCQSMLTVLEELIVIPHQWHVENVACLLVLCGNTLCFTILASKAINGRLFEVSRLLVYIVLVCEKEDYHMSWVVKLMHQIYSIFSTAAEKFRFIQQLESMFTQVTIEMLEFSVAENHLNNRDSFQSLHLLLNSTAHFHAKLLHMFLK